MTLPVIIRAMATPGTAPNCLKCAYFHITWQPRHPRACTLYNIKSLQLPSHEVFAATGRHCFSFVPKHRAHGK